MVSGSLALLYFLLGFHGGRQGSGPDRGQSPVEWGDFPSVRSFVRPPLWASQPGLRQSQPGLRPSQPGLRPSQPASQPQASGLAGWASGLAGWASGLAGWPRGGNGRTDRRTYVRKISPFYRTLSPIGAAALLPQGRSTPIKRSRARVSLTT